MSPSPILCAHGRVVAWDVFARDVVPPCEDCPVCASRAAAPEAVITRAFGDPSGRRGTK